MTLSHQDKFLTLTELLIEASPLWRPSPFKCVSISWQHEYPKLASACLNLGEEQLQYLEQSPSAAQRWLKDFLPQIEPMQTLLQLPPSTSAILHLAPRWISGIPNRKVEQIKAFAGAITPECKHLVDWCCGKAHLARLMSHVFQQPSIGVERNQTLIAQGQALANKQQASVSFVKADVLQQSITLPAHSHVLALHACGDLHRSLIRQAIQQQVPLLSIAPCCYPLWLQQGFTPLSRLAQQSLLTLTRDDLHLAVQETVTSSEREKQLNHELNRFRLGFDCLQRELNGVDAYLETPSLPKSIVRLGFEGFCRHIANIKQLDIPKTINFQHYYTLGSCRFNIMRRLQLVRHAYRRALELWLVLDIALTLEEANYQVSTTEFCERSLTPRNILISARLKST